MTGVQYGDRITKAARIIILPFIQKQRKIGQINIIVHKLVIIYIFQMFKD